MRVENEYLADIMKFIFFQRTDFINVFAEVYSVWCIWKVYRGR